MAYAEMMAGMLETALLDLLGTIGAQERGKYDASPLFEATVWTADESASFYARISLYRPIAGEPMRVFVWAWSVNTDLARYIGRNPPAREELDPIYSRGRANPGPTNSDNAGWSRAIAGYLCARVDGTGLDTDNPVPFFDLPV